MSPQVRVLYYAAEHAKLDAEIAEFDAETAKTNAALRELAATSAIVAALRIGGCRPKMVKAAAALLLKTLPLIYVEKDGETDAMLDNGWSIQSAIGNWLLSEAGQDFMEPVKTIGQFGAAIRRLH
jgi:hypothetical protein